MRASLTGRPLGIATCGNAPDFISRIYRDQRPTAAFAGTWLHINGHRTAALVDGAQWVVLRINEFPEHPLYTLFIDGERILDLDVLGLGSHPEYHPLTPEERQEVLALMRGRAPYGSEFGQPCDGDFCCYGLSDDLAAKDA